MKPLYDILVRDWLTRARLIELLAGLLVAGVVYWRTGSFLVAAAAALAGAIVVMIVGAYVRRMRALEETVEALRERVRRLQPAGEVAPQGDAPALMPERPGPGTEEPFKRATVLS